MTGEDLSSYSQLRRLFDGLVNQMTPDGDSAYATVEIGPNGMRLGKLSEQLTPALLMRDDELSAGLPQRTFTNIRLRYGVRLRDPAQGLVGAFTIVDCLARDPMLQDWFLRLIPSVQEALAVGKTGSVEGEISRLAELFSLVGTGARSELTGLWAELLLLANSEDLESAVASWRADDSSVHDFTHDGWHVEVKSTEMRGRRHTVSADQLLPADRVLLCSLRLERSDGGDSLIDLYEEIVGRLREPDLRYKVRKHVVAVVGRRLDEAEYLSFDRGSALRSILCYRAHNVPQPASPFPRGVSSVRFVSDLDVAVAEFQPSHFCRLWQNIITE